MAAKKDPWQFTVRFNPQNSTHRQAAEFLNQCGHFKAQCIAEAMDVYLRKKKREADLPGLDEPEGRPDGTEPEGVSDGEMDKMPVVPDVLMGEDIPGGGLPDAETGKMGGAAEGGALDDDDIAAILKSMGMFGDD
ncbi:MAG: hypothetical protein LUE14_07730 [Clostridiales bacterium]|nr:hypothetical protein [Clostridiales bacterium]